jgi:hypothetical protein
MWSTAKSWRLPGKNTNSTVNRPMDTIRQTQKKYGSRAMMLAIAAAIVLILAGFKPIGKGLLLGTLFSVINFVLMGESLPLRLGRSKRHTLAMGLGSILVRYAIMAVPLVMALRMAQFDWVAVACGLFMIQAVILAEQLYESLRSRLGYRRKEA